MLINSTGYCCGPGFTAIDAEGRCCASDASIDACGVCGGSGVAVDVLGVCCSAALPPSGICCSDGAGRPGVVDECGVCGGVNACDTKVTMQVSGSPSGDASVGIVAAVASSLGVPASTIRNLSSISSGGHERRALLLSGAGERALVGRFSRRCLVLFSLAHWRCVVQADTRDSTSLLTFSVDRSAALSSSDVASSLSTPALVSLFDDLGLTVVSSAVVERVAGECAACLMP
jgi:hypothetical protein